jgi:hypothetical protein
LMLRLLLWLQRLLLLIQQLPREALKRSRQR